MGTATKKLKAPPERYQRGFLKRMDRRTEICQRLQAAFDQVAEDAGGEDSLSHTKLSLIERFVFLEASLKTWESLIASDPETSSELISRWIQGVNSLQGLAKIIGIERQTKTTIDLKSYVKGQGRS